MKLIVIESPYAGEIERNVRYARRAMADALARGEAPIASHLLYTQEGILDDSKAEERQKGIEAGYSWWKCAELIIFYNDYGMSPGMDRAYKRAYEMGYHIHVVHRQIGENKQ